MPVTCLICVVHTNAKHDPGRAGPGQATGDEGQDDLRRHPVIRRAVSLVWAHGLNCVDYMLPLSAPSSLSRDVRLWLTSTLYQPCYKYIFVPGAIFERPPCRPVRKEVPTAGGTYLWAVWGIAYRKPDAYRDISAYRLSSQIQPILRYWLFCLRDPLCYLPSHKTIAQNTCFHPRDPSMRVVEYRISPTKPRYRKNTDRTRFCPPFPTPPLGGFKVVLVLPSERAHRLIQISKLEIEQAILHNTKPGYVCTCSV